MLRTVLRIVPWLIAALWLLSVLAIAWALKQKGESPVDFHAYRNAADALSRTGNPYMTREEARGVWLGMHEVEARVWRAYAAGRGPEQMMEEAAHVVPGPYVYPPTLALMVAQLDLDGFSFMVLLVLGIAVFLVLWLKETRGSPWWLLLAILPLEPSMSAGGANVELLLLALSLVACVLAWHKRPLLAAPFCAAVVVVKPFYGTLLLAFAVLQASTDRAVRRPMLAAAALTVALVGLEVARWGAPLRASAFDFLAHADDWSWFVLPPAEQTPMSGWNRAPYQLLASLGTPLTVARALVLLSGAAVLVIAVRRPQPDATFGGTFALSLALLYWMRPVGWGLNFLEVVLLPPVWPSLSPKQRLVLGACTAALIASRWAALATWALGMGLPLSTLQTGAVQWETVLVLPWVLLLALRAARPPTVTEPVPRAAELLTP
jgi:hypothetical protein